jgi:hypothetical protein
MSVLQISELHTHKKLHSKEEIELGIFILKSCTRYKNKI